MKSSIAHKDNPAHGGPDSRDRSTGNSLKGVDSSFACSTHVVAHSDNPARGGPDSRGRSTAHPSGLKNPSDPTEGIPPKQESDTLQKHHLYLPPEVNLKSLKLN